MKPHPFGSAPASLPPEVEARLKGSLESELSRPATPWWRDALVFVVGALVLFGIGSIAVHAAVSPLELSPSVWAQSLALLVVSLVAGVGSMAPWPQRTSKPLVLGGLVVGTVLVTQAVSMELGAFALKPGCFVWEFVGSLVPAGLALLAARNQAPKLSRVMVLGWAAGTATLAALQLKCPHRDVGHIVLLHLVPLALVIGATVLARRMMRTTSYVP